MQVIQHLFIYQHLVLKYIIQRRFFRKWFTK
jgi:hypothetical protein